MVTEKAVSAGTDDFKEVSTVQVFHAGDGVGFLDEVGCLNAFTFSFDALTFYFRITSWLSLRNMRSN